jgi:hypothetical protein
MKIPSVPLTSSLTSEDGSFCEGGDAITILPPSVAMFDQLANWLSRQTEPDPGGFCTELIGIGATALCLRWGTYLAILLDEHKPLDPRIGSAEISMISDPEMKRINFEFSARQLDMLRPMGSRRSTEFHDPPISGALSLGRSSKRGRIFRALRIGPRDLQNGAIYCPPATPRKAFFMV